MEIILSWINNGKKGESIMKLVRYNPFNDSFYDSVSRKKGFLPAVDIDSTEDDITLKVDPPGMKKDDISVNIEEKVLTIKGERVNTSEDKTERSFGLFERTFTLSDELLTEGVMAEFVDGVLEITLKKDKEKAEVKKSSLINVIPSHSFMGTEVFSPHVLLIILQSAP
jgi:HSP20 family protein